MSEDRTQPPSKRRRQLAREQGQAAHSPELTAAAGCLAALAILGLAGGDLASGLVELTRDALRPDPPVRIDPAALVHHLRTLMLGTAMPLGATLGGFLAGALAAHQLQVRGLWAAGLIAPDPARLWSPGRGGGLAAGVERIAWSILKVVLLGALSFWAIRAEWTEMQRLSVLEFPRLAPMAGANVLWPATILACALLAVGVADYGLRYLRFEGMLRTTPEEQREDQRIMEGDLSLRAKRRRLARAWRGDAPELLAGASLLVCGPDGLAVVLTGGPPPRRVVVRTAASGATGRQLIRTNRSARLPIVDAPGLALRLAREAGSAPEARGLAPALMAELAAAWPPG
ncbi:MAG: EscU/YscU/HrcU family type III secretion system export apparatus switch protein [Isosphaeraceae bacterium]